MIARRLAAEALGTAFLLAGVVGSGIMGERLADGNAAIALLANTIATGAALTVLISIFGEHCGKAGSKLCLLMGVNPRGIAMTDVAIEL